jgi:hypothetical protein
MKCPLQQFSIVSVLTPNIHMRPPEPLLVGLDCMLPDRLQNLGRILGRPLEPVGSVDMGDTEPRRVALIPFEVARRVETITSAVARFGGTLRTGERPDTYSRRLHPRYPSILIPSLCA